MRKNLFRGKSVERGGEWVKGYFIKGMYYLNDREMNVIAPLDLAFFPHCELSEYTNVIPETVGECSFVPDKNGVMMFEGDIVTGLFLFERSIKAVVTFQDGAFGLEWYRGNAKTFNAFTSICNVEYEVIGNIHDNPELLKCD